MTEKWKQDIFEILENQPPDVFLSSKDAKIPEIEYRPNLMKKIKSNNQEIKSKFVNALPQGEREMRIAVSSGLLTFVCTALVGLLIALNGPKSHGFMNDDFNEGFYTAKAWYAPTYERKWPTSTPTSRLINIYNTNYLNNANSIFSPSSTPSETVIKTPHP